MGLGGVWDTRVEGGLFIDGVGLCSTGSGSFFFLAEEDHGEEKKP